MVSKKYSLLYRKRIEVCTDPQRRFYDGGWAASKLVWTAWTELVSSDDEESIKGSLANFKYCSPNNQYKIQTPEETMKTVETT